MHCNSFQRSVPASNFIHFQFFLLLKSSMAFHCPKNNHRIILHPQFSLITLLCSYHIETHTHICSNMFTHTQTKICQKSPNNFPFKLHHALQRLMYSSPRMSLTSFPSTPFPASLFCCSSDTMLTASGSLCF